MVRKLSLSYDQNQEYHKGPPWDTLQSETWNCRGRDSTIDLSWTSRDAAKHPSRTGCRKEFYRKEFLQSKILVVPLFKKKKQKHQEMDIVISLFNINQK